MLTIIYERNVNAFLHDVSESSRHYYQMQKFKSYSLTVRIYEFKCERVKKNLRLTYACVFDVGLF